MENYSQYNQRREPQKFYDNPYFHEEEDANEKEDIEELSDSLAEDDLALVNDQLVYQLKREKDRKQQRHDANIQSLLQK